ncbi:MAG: sensor histidine kinase [Candidatus Krumholzibacteriia bacterium]
METHRAPPPSPPESADSDLFRRQESALVGLNLTVLAALVLVHLGFSRMLGAPNRPVLVASATFFLLQTVELYFLQTRPAAFGPRAIRLYPRVSVPVKLLLGVAVAYLGGAEDGHYTVLLVLPIMSAAFRFRLPAVLLTAAVAGLLTMLDLRLYYHRHPPLMPREFYEAATIVLIYFVTGIVVAHLTGQLRHDRRRLRASLDELERTKDRLVRDEKLAAVGRLAGAIAHEIRNPVAMILSSARLVKDEGPPDGPRAELCDIMVGEARRLERLTTDFLDYARQRPLERHATTTAELLAYLAGLAQARAQESGIAVRTACEDDCAVLVDPFRLQQALLNLLVNALQASPPGGAVTAGARCDGEIGVVFYVENEGGPIAPESVPRLGEPFFTTRAGGSGLGLAITRSIARAHGGDLSLVRNDGGRVRFELSLPDARRSAAPPEVT